LPRVALLFFQVNIRKHKVVYHLLDDLRAMLTAALPVKVAEVVEGSAVVKQVFEIKRKGMGKVHIAGSVVETGSMKKGSCFRVLRDGQVVHTMRHGATLQHFQVLRAPLKSKPATI